MSAREEIEETKAELVEAKRIRKNRMEYDALAKVIMNHSDRETSEARLEQVKAEQKQLEEKQVKLEDKLDIRKKQFHVLVSTIHQLQVTIMINLIIFRDRAYEIEMPCKGRLQKKKSEIWAFG